jgi:UDP-2,4-diacetamido-2,4,6-trideoxy-beta-L-altropyranose hydrolase
MKVAFRADASRQIGSGHMMRCLALADEIRARGGHTRFISRDEPGHLGDLVVTRGHQLHLLPTGLSFEDDAAACRELLAQGVGWLVVDHYGLEARWERSMRSVAKNVMAIDDLAARPHDCDLLLDQNVFSGDPYAALVPLACRKLLGSRYALLRQIFRRLRVPPAERRRPSRRVLVFLGAADPEDLTFRTLEALDSFPELSVDVVADSNHSGSSRHRRWCESRADSRLLSLSDRFPEILGAADIAVGAGGTTTWERCCIGVPSVVIGIAENQYRVAEAVAEWGAHLYLGPSDRVTKEDIRCALQCLMASPGLRASLADRGRSLVDGLGCRRVADCLLPLALTIRAAEAADCDAMFEWRNDALTRRHAFDSGPLDLASHREWHQRSLSQASRVLLIGEDRSGPIGVVRYDLSANQALVSVYLAPMRRGEGLGAALIEAASRYLARGHPEIRQVIAEVRPDNSASCRAFSDAGYTERSRQYVIDL